VKIIFALKSATIKVWKKNGQDIFTTHLLGKTKEKKYGSEMVVVSGVERKTIYTYII